ncbi:MAG: hypothetical protein GY781_22430, partial [Gammaproteobacteria bacterium]|nr:hypothetical protein [Gammaproteobacteria bacterium]
YAYIEFWHYLDLALANEIAEVNVDQITNLGPALINDEVWLLLFGLGRSDFNGISLSLTERIITVEPLANDQLNNTRPMGLLSDIGAIEINSP